MRVYGFQITPGSDSSLGYCESADAAFKKAREHRRDINRWAAPDRLDPMAVYEVVLAEVTADALITVLNEPDKISEVFVASKRRLGYATDEDDGQSSK